jgi:mRNA-degrading endonuclease toxin of MazEF toxin-antitoxin module
MCYNEGVKKSGGQQGGLKMFKAGSTTPKIGEIRLGYVDESVYSEVHKYKGIHPYLVVSNNVYNKASGQCEVIPFTTKRRESRNPVHVDYSTSEVIGLSRDSTLVIEGRDTLLNTQLSDPIGVFTDDNWQKAARAMVIQCPMLSKAFA